MTDQIKSFVPLHLHSDASFLDSLSQPKAIVKRAKELGYPAIALTDHGNCFNHIRMYEECKKAGVKFIPGCELYVTPKHADKDRKSYHLTVVAISNTGLANLYKMMTWANCPMDKGGGFFYRARVDWEMLEKFSEGIVCLTGCMSSIVNFFFARHDYETGKYNALKLKDIFGTERLFVEIQNVNEAGTIYIPEQNIILDFSRRLADELHLRTVCTNDSHYIQKADCVPHEVLKAIYSRCTLADPIRQPGDEKGRMVYNGFDYYLRSDQEMRYKFTKEDVDNSNVIADMCNVDIPLKQNHMPKFDTNKTDDEVYELLRKECLNGYKWRKLDQSKDKELYIERMKVELKDIKEAHLQNYFMIVWDVIRFCRENKIPVGKGRGSAGGSLTSYLLRITDIDPIRYGLIWERFWNRGRKNSMPDIDIDVSIDRRAEVVEYLRSKFGKDRVFPMVTFSTMTTKAVIKDVGKVLGLDFDYTNDLTKHVPHKCKSVAEAIQDDEYIHTAALEGVDKEAKKWMEQLAKETDPIKKSNLQTKIEDRKDKLTKTFAISQVLEGCMRQRSCHACATLIADSSIMGKIPLCFDPQGKKLLTGFDMYDLEKMGYLKLDILGLKTLSVIARCHPEGIDAVKEFDDPAVYRLISSGNTKGVFQLESPLGVAWCRKLKPNNLLEVAALISIIRPAVLEVGLADEYVKNRENKEYNYIHADLEPILKDTYGVCIYQEQMIEIAKVFAGFSLERADNLRKAVGKKIPEEIAKLKDEFINGVKTKYNNENLGKELWSWIEKGAEYGFNKSHAVGYALISYVTAYMKLYHKEKFFTAMLQLSDNDPKPQDEISALFYDCKLFGVEVVPPSIEKGNIDFELIDNKIYYGLKHIKRVGSASIQKIRSLPHKTWEEIFQHGQSLKIDVMQALILSGALDYTGKSRLSMKTQIDFIHHLTPKELDFFQCLLGGRTYVNKNKTVEITGQRSFEDALTFLINYINTDNVKKKVFASNRAPKLLELSQKTLEACKAGELSIKEKAGFELFYLGVPATCTEVDIYQDNRKTHALICAKREISGKRIATIGIINRIVEKKDRNGNTFVFISLFDSTYLMDAVLWSDAYTSFSKLVEMGRIVYVEGVKRKDLYSIDHIESL